MVRFIPAVVESQHEQRERGRAGAGLRRRRVGGARTSSSALAVAGAAGRRVACARAGGGPAAAVGERASTPAVALRRRRPGWAAELLALAGPRTTAITGALWRPDTNAHRAC